MPTLQKTRTLVKSAAISAGAFYPTTTGGSAAEDGLWLRDQVIDHAVIMYQCDQPCELWIFRKDHDGVIDQGTPVKQSLAATTATTWGTVIIPRNDPATHFGAAALFCLKVPGGSPSTVGAVKAQLYK